MAETAAEMRNVAGKDNRNGNDSDIHGMPPNLTGAAIESVGSNPAERTSHHVEEEEVRHTECNYCTVRRWKHRLSLWKEYLANTSEPKELPDPKDFFFSTNPVGDKNFVESLIWGTGSDSMESRLSELEALQKNYAHQINLSHHESISIDDEEPNTSDIPPDPNMSSEALAECENLRREVRRRNEQLIKLDKEIIRLDKKLIELDKERHQQNIKRGLQHIQTFLGVSHAAHELSLMTLSDLTEIGNEIAGSRDCSFFVDTNRIDTAPFGEPFRTPAQQICRAKPDNNFLKELLEKEEIIAKQEDLLKLQTFVAALLEKADVVVKGKGGVDKRIKASVDAILEWTPETTVQSLKRTKVRFGRPPSKGCETIADQPILCALIVRILVLLGQGSTPSLSSEKDLAPVGTTGQDRRIDLVVDEYREFLHSIFPEMLAPAEMEGKEAVQDDQKELKAKQRKARVQVLRHLVAQLLCSFDFGGFGRDDVVCGVALSMVSVQVLEMQLTKVGTDEVDIVFRQTPPVPLLGKSNDERKIHEVVQGDVKNNGVLLLASAILDIPRKSVFDNDRESTKLDDLSATKYYSMNSQDPEEHVGIEIQSLLGTGGFSHVVRTGDDKFMKIPRSKGMVKSLIWECEILGKLEPCDRPWFPRIMPWGVSVVNLSMRNEISQIKVLRLQGIVGCPLCSYCNYKDPNMRADFHRVIQDVYEALTFAHSKGIFHMDGRPSNIIVKCKGTDSVLDVLLADWGCSRLEHETLENGQYVGCPPYSHDELLGDRDGTTLMPKAEFDFASLGYTWYHLIRGVLGWQFDRPTWVSVKQLADRRVRMEKFFKIDIDNNQAGSVPMVRQLFCPPKKRPWQRLFG